MDAEIARRKMVGPLKNDAYLTKFSQ